MTQATLHTRIDRRALETAKEVHRPMLTRAAAQFAAKVVAAVSSDIEEAQHRFEVPFGPVVLELDDNRRVYENARVVFVPRVLQESYAQTSTLWKLSPEQVIVLFRREVARELGKLGFELVDTEFYRRKASPEGGTVLGSTFVVRDPEFDKTLA